MRNRFLEHADLLKSLCFVEPEIALNFEKRKVFPDLSDVVKFFPFISKFDVAREWRNLEVDLNSEKKNEYMKLEVEEFWRIISNIKTNLVLEYPSLKALKSAVFSLPHLMLNLKELFLMSMKLKMIKVIQPGFHC